MMRLDSHQATPSLRQRTDVARLLAATILLLLAAIPLAAQDTIRNDCCALLYSTGRWLGWSAAFLEYTRDREAPTPDDTILLQSLEEAGQNAQAANASCLQGLPAWPAWRQKQLWLAHQIEDLQGTGRGITSHRHRRQLAFSAIDTTFEQWADELSNVRWNGDVLHTPTCAAYYFKLGFALAAATQAFRQADEAILAGNEQAATHQLAQTRLRLEKAHDVLRAYEAMARRDHPRAPCAEIDVETLIRMVGTIAHRAPTRASYPEELRIVSGISDGVGQRLLASCLPGTAPPPASRLPVDDTAWIVNQHPVPWVFHRNGTVEAAGLWSGIWEERSNGVFVSMTYLNIRDEFLVVFSADGRSFIAYKDGRQYRNGVRVR